ncbi:MAG TPA: hypothetical protein VKB46_26390 [Pyrinomonadaceae bacterium]|nr:hypothetical protein [Pyrinomonadaceae bacterium]
MICTRLISAAWLLGLLVYAPTGAFPVSRAAADCGRTVSGVQLCLASSGSTLEVELRNVGEHDVTLNLGIVLANGKVQLPNRIAIKLTDARGQTRLFRFADKRYPAIAGRVDDYIVPLRTGSTYTLQMTLDQFWCQETSEFSIPLLSGENYLTAQFEGAGANAVNSDMPGIKLMNFWLGKAESNVLMLHR